MSRRTGVDRGLGGIMERVQGGGEGRVHGRL